MERFTDILEILGACVVAATFVLEPISRRTKNTWDNKVVALLHDLISRFSLRRSLPPPAGE
jgi:hypothetical protein